MYSNQLVASLKVDGKVLREDTGDKNSANVSLPFGSEYTLLLKNLSSKKAVVKVSIDGEDVVDGNQLLVDANDSLELQGFMSNSTAKNRFKFIERTKQIEDYRGIRSDDSLIRVEFQFEKDKPIIVEEIHRKKWINDYWDYPQRPNPWIPVWYEYSPNTSGDYSSASTTTGNTGAISCYYSSEDNNINVSNNILDVGITVKGSEINQEFRDAYIGSLEESSHVIVLKLQGYKSHEKKIEKPLFVQTRLTCPTCGNSNNSRNKYCPTCGTYLQ